MTRWQADNRSVEIHLRKAGAIFAEVTLQIRFVPLKLYKQKIKAVEKTNETGNWLKGNDTKLMEIPAVTILLTENHRNSSESISKQPLKREGRNSNKIK